MQENEVIKFKPLKPPRVRRAKPMASHKFLTECDAPVSRSGPCDGYTASRLLHDYPLSEHGAII